MALISVFFALKAAIEKKAPNYLDLLAAAGVILACYTDPPKETTLSKILYRAINQPEDSGDN